MTFLQHVSAFLPCLMLLFNFPEFFFKSTFEGCELLMIGFRSIDGIIRL